MLHVITGLNDGGAEAVLHRLVVNAPGDLHHVVCLTGHGKYVPILRSCGAEVTVLGMPRGQVTLRGLRGLWQAIRHWQPSVVQTWMYHANLLGGVVGRLRRVPVVWGIHHTTLDRQRSARTTIWVARACAWLSRWVPTRIVCCAEKAREVHALLGYDVGRMTVIPNGYELSHFAPDARARTRLRAEWGVPDDQPLVGMVGRFDPQKDHANLIAALGGLHAAGTNFSTVLVGSGIDASNRALTNQIAEVGLAQRTRLLGPRADIPAVMSALDVHILSSYGEAFPNVLAEAMACGTPCVTTDVGDAARIVGDTGWVVPPRDSKALADGISEVLIALQEPASWQERKKRSRRRIVDEFGIDEMVSRYRDVWQEAVDPR